MRFTQQASKRLEQMNGQEGRRTQQIERITSALPSSTWLVAAGASIIGSMSLRASGRAEDANFVGQWAPTLLLIGLYNKLVKVGGSR